MIPEVKGQGDSVWQTIREHSEQNIYRINIISNVRGTFREPSYNNFWSFSVYVFDHIPSTLPEAKGKGESYFADFRETFWEHSLDHYFKVSTLDSLNVLRTL